MSVNLPGTAAGLIVYDATQIQLFAGQADCRWLQELRSNRGPSISIEMDGR